MTTRIPRPDPSVMALTRMLADTQRRLREIETASQAGFTSVEGRSLDFYDPVTDELIGSIGMQKDGTFGFDHAGGAKPETPTVPDVNPIPGGAIVAWDGRFEEAQSMLAIDRIAVHMDETPGFTPDRDTEVAAVRSTGAGGTAVIPIDDGVETYVKLVAVSKGGVWSDPSAEVFVAAVDSATAHFQDEFALTVNGAQDLQLTYQPEPFSEHLYWHPGGGAGLYQQEDVAWTREGLVVSLLDTGRAPQIGDLVVVEYDYRDGEGVLVNWGASGWSYTQVSTGDTEAKAAVGYDDSSWAVGTAPFANNVPPPGAGGAWLSPATGWTVNTEMWVRRHLTAPPTGATVQVTLRIDNSCLLFWNGTQVGGRYGDEGGDQTSVLTIPSGLVQADNVIAVHAEDHGLITYLDVRVEIL